MGLNRYDDFLGVEAEEPGLLIAVNPFPEKKHLESSHWITAIAQSAASKWTGRANLLDPHPVYRWPVIDIVAEATRGQPSSEHLDPDPYPPLVHDCEAKAAEIILNRRSAQRFDSKFSMAAATFFRILDCLLARPAVPWDIWSYTPRIHPIFFVHRVEELDPGLYALLRHPSAEPALRAALRIDFLWQRPESTPPHIPLFKLASASSEAFARTMSCHQAIAADSCFTLGMAAEFEPVVESNPWRYRQLHWEAGLLGHVLYLEAEAAGLRGTGIGCYFDDVFHELLGIETKRYQSLYQFTAGYPLTDERMITLPAYPDRPDPS